MTEFNAIHASLIPIDPARPTNPNGGKVLVWDSSHEPVCGNPAANGDYAQRYAIVDPLAQTFQLHTFQVLANEAPPAYNPVVAATGFHGLFCSGHCWLRDGKLLTAGGDDWSDDNNIAYAGSQIVCLFDPWAPGNVNHWSVLRETAVQPPWPLVQLQQRRWYPTLLRLADDQDTVIVAGGVRRWILANNWYETTPHDFGPESYEAIHTWDPTQPMGQRQKFAVDRRLGVSTGGGPVQGLFSGPSLSGNHSLFYYPRLHLTSNASLNSASAHGLAWSVAFPAESSWVEHVLTPAMSAAQWPGPHAQIPIAASLIEEPSTLLLPVSSPLFRDVIGMIGGQRGWGHQPNQITNEVWLLDTKVAVPQWTAGPNQHYPRKFHKTVILPDLSLLTIGGGQFSGHGDPPGCEVFWPEVFRNGQWRFCAKEEHGGVGSRRTYHSSAVLLPTGEVLSCGGNTRNVPPGVPFAYDYQVFRPHYFDGNPPRPQWTAPPQASITYGQAFEFHYSVPALQGIDRVVLISPGSWTHAQDPGQRCLPLDFDLHLSGKFGIAYTPINKSQAPPGLYMVWLVSSAGIPSVAQWVRLE